MRNVERYMGILRREIVLALGCTEPAAVALCAAACCEMLEGKPERISVKVSPYIYKNGMNVGIPGARGMRGLLIAVAMGAICRDESQGLQVFKALDDDQLKTAQGMVDEGRIEVGIADASEKVYIEAISTDGTHAAKCVIAKYHDCIVLKELDGQVVFRQLPDAETDATEEAHAQLRDDFKMSVEGIYEFCRDVPIKELYPLREVVEVNCRIAAEGLQGEYGLKVGKSLQGGNKASFLQSDVSRQAVAYTAAAADARMAGCELPVMSTAGSGNQGLTASLPIIVAARQMGIDEENMLRALGISELITIHTKSYLGRLSVLCGCGISSAIGVCAGLIHMLDGDFEAISAGIRTMVADLTGMVCDGAKPGCAIKIATSVQAAFQAASLALMGTGADEKDGIICKDIEKTLENMGRLGNEGMTGTNDAILQMMMKR